MELSGFCSAQRLTTNSEPRLTIGIHEKELIKRERERETVGLGLDDIAVYRIIVLPAQPLA